MNEDHKQVTNTESDNHENSKGSNWPIIIIGLASLLFVVYLVYTQYKANNP